LSIQRSSSDENLRTRFTWLLTAAAIVLAATIAARASAPPQQGMNSGELTQEQEDAIAQAAEETIERACIQCHPMQNITRTRRTTREWKDTVATMASRGANATEQDLAKITQYLTRYYGIVRVNTATAEELSAVLGLSPKDSTAIVEYRKAHGNFADLGALSKVDGINKAKIDEQPEAILFN
jgi:competence ComEA-like helix-hairpin-helix protein